MHAANDMTTPGTDKPRAERTTLSTTVWVVPVPNALHQQPATRIAACIGHDDDMGLLVFEEQKPPSPPKETETETETETENGRKKTSPIIIIIRNLTIMRHSPNALRRLALLHLLLLSAPPRHPPPLYVNIGALSSGDCYAIRQYGD
jgi:hypothetical protein